MLRSPVLLSLWPYFLFYLIVLVKPLEENTVESGRVDERVFNEIFSFLASELLKERVDEFFNKHIDRVFRNLIKAFDQQGDQGFDFFKNKGITKHMGCQPVKYKAKLSDKLPFILDDWLVCCSNY